MKNLSFHFAKRRKIRTLNKTAKRWYKNVIAKFAEITAICNHYLTLCVSDRNELLKTFVENVKKTVILAD